jgi:hypothetical protein
MLELGRRRIGERLGLAPQALHPISVKDLQFSRQAESTLNQVVGWMALLRHLPAHPPLSESLAGAMACHAFWIDGAQHLALFIWTELEHRILVIHRRDWRFREEIAFH